MAEQPGGSSSHRHTTGHAAEANFLGYLALVLVGVAVLASAALAIGAMVYGG